MSSHGPLVDLKIGNDGISLMTLQRPPVNIMNLNLLHEMNQALDEIEKNKCKGLIISSALPTVFSAGLDISELYKPDLKRTEEFYRLLLEAYLKIFDSKFITTAAINGHALAGGCLLAIATEYRVMVNGEYKIGFNEAAFGMTVPNWVMDALCHILPVKKAEYILTTAQQFTADEALKVGLIDETATDKLDVIDKCKSFIRRFNDIPYSTRSLTKQRIREGIVGRFKKRREIEVKEYLTYVSDPQIQQSLELYIKALKNKNST
ncbi:unnamed protein product, partial [Brenthis ino]